jgi:hypothetical protein
MRSTNTTPPITPPTIPPRCVFELDMELIGDEVARGGKEEEEEDKEGEEEEDKEGEEEEEGEGEEEEEEERLEVLVAVDDVVAAFKEVFVAVADGEAEGELL